MNSLKPVFGGCFLILALAFGSINARAQDEPQEPSDTKPKPAARSLPPIDAGNTQDENPNALQPDTTPLTGVQNATLGSPEVRHSYWVPGVQYAGTIQSNGYGTANSSGWIMSNYLIGNVGLLKAWSRFPTSRQLFWWWLLFHQQCRWERRLPTVGSLSNLSVESLGNANPGSIFLSPSVRIRFRRRNESWNPWRRGLHRAHDSRTRFKLCS